VNGLSPNGPGARGPCLRCVVSGLIATALAAWLLMVLVRTVRAVVARSGQV